MNFDDVYVAEMRFGRRYRTMFHLARWVFEHPNDKILLCTASQEEADKIMLEIKLLFGLPTTNITVQKMDKGTDNENLD